MPSRQFPSENDLYVNEISYPTVQTDRESRDTGILQRAAKRNLAAAEQCIKTYGNFVWSLAKRLTNSNEEAEAATKEIFMEIWKYAGDDLEIRAVDKTTIIAIARRRLIKRSSKSG